MKNIIYDKFIESGNILVAANRIDARRILIEYAYRKRKSVDQNSVIGLAGLKKMLLDNGERNAEAWDRLKFLLEYLPEMQDSLPSFIPSDADSIGIGTYKALMRILEDLGSEDDIDKYVRIGSLKQDLKKLRKAYMEYLVRHNIKNDEDNINIHRLDHLEQNYTLLFPETSIEMMQFLKRIADTGNIKILSLEKRKDLPKLLRFENERLEFGYVMEKIAELAKKSIRTDEIQIVATDSQRIQEELKRAASDFSIPLSFSCSKSLKDTPYGKFVSGINNIRKEKGSFNSLSSLFLDTGLQFAEKDSAMILIQNMIDNSARFISDLHIVNDEAAHFRSTIEELINEKSPLSVLVEKAEAKLMGRKFFKEEEKKIMREMLSKYPDKLDLILENLQVREEEDKSAVRVISFGEGVSDIVRYRFIISLNEENGHLRHIPFSFLEDYERNDDAGSSDGGFEITMDVLDAYNETAEKLCLSFSSKAYELSATIPSYFIKTPDKIMDMPENGKGILTEKMDLDADKHENLWHGCITEERKHFIKASDIDDAEKCLLKAYLNSRKGFSENRTRFSAYQADVAKEGTMMHELMKGMFEKNGAIKEPSQYDIKGKLTAILSKEEYRNIPKGSIMQKYYGGIQAFIEKHKNEIVVDMEHKIRENEKYPLLKDCRLDIILKDEGSCIIADYKTGRLNNKIKKSKQLDVYKMLLEKEDGKYHQAAMEFYSLSEASSTEGTSGAEKCLDEIRDKIHDGSWEMGDPEEYSGPCTYCPYHGLCRRGF